MIAKTKWTKALNEYIFKRDAMTKEWEEKNFWICEICDTFNFTKWTLHIIDSRGVVLQCWDCEVETILLKQVRKEDIIGKPFETGKCIPCYNGCNCVIFEPEIHNPATCQCGHYHANHYGSVYADEWDGISDRLS